MGVRVVSGLVLIALTVSGCALRQAPARTGGEGPSGRTTVGPRSAAADGAVGTLEARDPELAQALQGLAILPAPAQHRRVAERYFHLKVFDAAYDHFARARDLDHADGAAFEGLARVWRTWGFLERGLADAHRGVYFAPVSPAAHNTLGTILVELGRGEDARRAFERTIELDPAAAYAVNNLCYLSFLSGALERAIAECRRALMIDPGLTSARNNLALAYASNRQEDLARQEFLASGDAAAASYNIGLVLLAEQRYAPATEAFDSASRQRPAWQAPRVRARKTRALASAEAASSPR